MCVVKMPSWMGFESREFTSSTVDDEIAAGVNADDIVHKIRWRKSKDEHGDEIRESNARLVTWSDGSVQVCTAISLVYRALTDGCVTQLLVGSSVFDVIRTSLPENLHCLFDAGPDGLQKHRAGFQAKLLVKSKDVVAPKRPRAVVAPVQTTRKIYTVKDPEQEVAEKVKVYRVVSFMVSSVTELCASGIVN